MNHQHCSMCSFTEILDYGWLFLIFLLLGKSSAADYQYEACAPRPCGKINISFPFYIQGVQEPFCGYSDLGINCSSPSSPTIHVPENDYVIDNISYQDETLMVHNAAVSSITNCLPQIQNITKNPLLYVAENSSLLLLSKCTKTLPEVLQKYRKNLCHAEDEGWGLTMLGDDQNLNIAFEACTRNVLVPVGGDGNVRENGVVDYNGLLRRGFVLNWNSSDCSRCERSGGRCGLNTNSVRLMCFCPDRPHYVSCKLQMKVVGASFEESKDFKSMQGSIICEVIFPRWAGISRLFLSNGAITLNIVVPTLISHRRIFFQVNCRVRVWCCILSSLRSLLNLMKMDQDSNSVLN